MIVLPAATSQSTEYEDFYESTLAQPVNITDTDIYPVAQPASGIGFLVLDPYGTNPEIIYYNFKGANFIRVPSATDGEGRGVGNTTPRQYDTGTKIGMYSIAEFFEGLANGLLMRDGFLQSRHFGAGIDPNSWIGTGESWNYVGNNSQKEYQYVTAGDKTTKYSKGMKVRMPRVAAVSTQSAAFSAPSSQYATRASVSNMTFTGAYTLEAQIYLNSYPTGVQGGSIIGRTDSATGGFILRILPNGQLDTYYATGSNFTDWLTITSVPLKQWVHVAVVVSSTTTKTIQGFYINGVAVGFKNGSAQAAANLTQTGNVSIGAAGAGVATSYLDGFVSEARIWSVARSQADILDNMNQSVATNATGLAAYYKLNGDFNDSTANANHLTAQAGAIATNASAPLKAMEYGVITKLSFAGGNTTITVFTGLDHNAPHENLTGVGYSAARTPYGFPADKSRWKVRIVLRDDITMGIGSASVYYNAFGFVLSVPSGAWNIREAAVVNFYGTAAGTPIGRTAVTTETVAYQGSTVNRDPFLTDMSTRWGGNANSIEVNAPVNISTPIDINSMTTYTALFRTESANGGYNTRHFGAGIDAISVFEAECAYI